MTDYTSGLFGLILGLFLGFITMLIFYLFMIAENKKYSKKQQEMIENLAKLIEQIDERRKFDARIEKTGTGCCK